MNGMAFFFIQTFDIFFVNPPLSEYSSEYTDQLRPPAFADLGGLLKRTSVEHAGRSGSQFLELSLLTHKGQSSFDFRFPKPALREVALTTQSDHSNFTKADAHAQIQSSLDKVRS